ncbi:MAG: ComEC/Rec2 family competence protein [Magnetococcales bacterium]|nr:ComEC/Rec2 family competence protein [Magnetococcales bacterium]
MPHEQLGLAEALLIGKRGRMDASLRQALQSTNTFHLVAISGLHVGLVAGMVFLFFRTALVRFTPLSRRYDLRPVAALLTLPVCVIYGLIAGGAVSTQRAVIMIALLMAAYMLGRTRHIGRAVSVAAILVLTLDPLTILEPGFQFSFIAVGALILYWPLQHSLSVLIADRLFPKIPEEIETKKQDPFRAQKETVHPTLRLIVSSYQRLFRSIFTQRRRLTIWFMQLVMVTILMGVILAPLSAVLFHRLSPWGFLANLVAVPWVSLVSVPLAVMTLLTSIVSDTLSQGMAILFGWSLMPLQEWILSIGSLDGAWIRTAGPTMVGAYVAVLSLLLIPILPGIRRKVLFSVVALFALLLPRPQPPEHQLWGAVLDVGQGQSVVMRTATGAWWVIDAGGPFTPRFNVGESVVSPFLWHYGVSHLERVVISHPQRDHLSGVESLLRNFTVKQLWIGHDPTEEKKNSVLRSLLKRARNRGTTIIYPQEGESIHQLDGLRVRISMPNGSYGRHKDLNERSLVMEAAWRDVSLLFPGDIGKRREKILAEKGWWRDVSLLLAPHHGSAGSSAQPMVDATSPEHVIFSTGFNNRFRFPRPETVERWRLTGASLWDTGSSGTLLFQSNGERIDVWVAGLDRATGHCQKGKECSRSLQY